MSPSTGETYISAHFRVLDYLFTENRIGDVGMLRQNTVNNIQSKSTIDVLI